MDVCYNYGMKTLRVLPRSGIESWNSWPDDVLPILTKWNKSKELTFVRINYWRGNPKVIFQCEACLEWHEPASNGVAVLEGQTLCDMCLIVAARISM